MILQFSGELKANETFVLIVSCFETYYLLTLQRPAAGKRLRAAWPFNHPAIIAQKMKLQLTSELLDFLTGQGYRHCFSRTTLSGSDNDMVTITLTPAFSRPKTRHLPKAYDTHFCLNQEPRQMATGLTGILVLVDIKEEVLVAYFKCLISPNTGNIPVMRSKRHLMYIQK
ncbi:hypothetical protein [Mucilaginibacter sp. SG564]|uniref:hypothetical protein n=1 Tax=Mucilaginibacter sp. SG564 TaxID=2587022 RepID=UPI001552210F|nr:hypothetical protein [Mucilaginibacter sp. SG564]NOW97192.1 hypothetical protein [Mucilaginibacter sp. SG564]